MGKKQGNTPEQPKKTSVQSGQKGEQMGMEETAFYTYVSKLLQETGHMTQTAPIYANCSIQTALFIENERSVTLSETDCATLGYVSHVSLLAELTWSDGAEKVQLYAVTTDFPQAHRSQDIAETHRLLQGAWRNRHSIVFFQNADAWAVSFADDEMCSVLSDWFPFADEDTAVSARLSIENISLSDSTAYFQDFQYAMARDYYVHPISRSAARYAWLPRDLYKTQYIEETDVLTEPYVSQEEFRSIVHENICYYENEYGDDYVTASNTQTDQAEAERQAKEIALQSLVLAIQQVQQRKQAEAKEQQARKIAVHRLVVALKKIIEKAERLEREKAERQAKAEAERQAKEIALQSLVLAIQQVQQRKQAEAKEQQARKIAAHRLAVALREIIEKAERLEREEAERQAKEAIERIEQCTRQHDETVSRLQQRCRAEMELVQAELVSVSARLFQLEQALARLHILQFKKKKDLMSERDELLLKQKKLQLLLAKIEDSLQKQLAAEDIAYARSLATLQQ